MKKGYLMYIMLFSFGMFALAVCVKRHMHKKHSEKRAAPPR